MSETQTPDDWRELYRDALQEFDPARIDEAQKAVRNRAVELWYAGSPTGERRELDAAIYFLNLFTLLGSSEEKSSRAMRTSGGAYDA